MLAFGENSFKQPECLKFPAFQGYFDVPIFLREHQVIIVPGPVDDMTGPIRIFFEFKIFNLIFKNINVLLEPKTILVKDMEIPEGYKTIPNYIHGRQVITTPPEKVSEEMKELLDWFKENKNQIHPLQLAARFHGKFEGIHPFEDGNGRVGRFLLNIILLDAGYPPLIIRKTQRISYFNALEKFDNGRKITLETFLYERLKETHEKFFKVYIKYLK